MTGNPTPRQMLQGLLQGIAPPRPLFLPIVFSPGARVENQPLPAFLANPTKICNAQRQLRGPLRTDGFSCYFDPFLEVEALGAKLEWGAAGQPPVVRWPPSAAPGELPDDLRSPEEAIEAGRIPVALDVLRRLKAMLRDDSILIAGVTGPFTLAARLSQLESGGAAPAGEIPEIAAEVAASMVTRISGAFAEAGASLIFIQEAALPALSPEGCAAWASALEPSFNVVRFYEALPVLQLTASGSFAANSAVMLQRSWDCGLCLPCDEIPPRPAEAAPEWSSITLGLSVPLDAFQLDDAALQTYGESLRRVVAAWRPAILTTAGDIPLMTDMKRMSKVLEKVPRMF